MNAISGEQGLSIADFHLLGALMMEAPEPMRASDLAPALNVTNAALTGRIRRLETAGLIQRSAIEDDRRAHALSLTEDGAAAVQAVGSALQRDGRFIRHLSQLPATDRTALDRILQRLHTLMDRDFTPTVR